MFGRCCLYVWSRGVVSLVDMVCMFGRWGSYVRSIEFACFVDRVC